MPDELPVEVFEADFATHLVAWRKKPESQDTVDEGSVAAVGQKDKEG